MDAPNVVVFRFAQAVLLLLVICLVGTGTGVKVCGLHAGNELCEARSNWKMSEWGNSYGEEDFKGQYVIFVLTVVLLVLAVGMILCRFKFGVQYKKLQLTYIAIGIVICFVFGSLEFWYGTGFGLRTPETIQKIKLPEASFTIGGWLAAGVLFYLLAFIYIADLLYSVKFETGD